VDVNPAFFQVSDDWTVVRDDDVNLVTLVGKKSVDPLDAATGAVEVRCVADAEDLHVRRVFIYSGQSERLPWRQFYD
jgi:hypothetical protein